MKLIGIGFDDKAMEPGFCKFPSLVRLDVMQ